MRASFLAVRVWVLRRPLFCPTRPGLYECFRARIRAKAEVGGNARRPPLFSPSRVAVLSSFSSVLGLIKANKVDNRRVV